MLTVAPDGPVEVIDPVTQRAYVIVSAEVYQRVQALMADEGQAVDDMSAMVVELAPEDWEDATNYETQ